MKAKWLTGRRALAACIVLLLPAGGWLGCSFVPESSEKPNDIPGSHPPLFPASPACDSDVRAYERAQRLERHGELHAERYPYDPADGVRAVQHLQKAASCYTRAGRRGHAMRVKRRGSRLAARIETDYASARTALVNTLASGRWTIAVSETRRLLRLTHHLRPSPYVEWLEMTLGKVAARASEMR